jgi:hypothetical protein
MLCWCVKTLIFSHLNDESDLCAVAEVTDAKLGQFLDERLPSKFKFILTLLDQVFEFVWLQLHYLAD